MLRWVVRLEPGVGTTPTVAAAEPTSAATTRTMGAAAFAAPLSVTVASHRIIVMMPIAWKRPSRLVSPHLLALVPLGAGIAIGIALIWSGHTRIVLAVVAVSTAIAQATIP